MALPIPRFVPTPVGFVPKPPRRTGATVAPGVYNPNEQQPSSGGAGRGYGGGGAYGSGSGSGSGFGEAVSPWEARTTEAYNAARGPVPYQNEWRQGVAQAMTLGNRDYEGALRGFAQEDVNRQITSADNQLGAMGMRELGLRADVQGDRAKARTDASTRAMIDSQGIKSNALQTMQGMLGAASGVELDRIGQMISAAGSGSGAYNSFQSMAIPLQEKLGATAGAASAVTTREALDPNAARRDALAAWMKANPGLPSSYFRG